jgi:hypothetical protein
VVTVTSGILQSDLPTTDESTDPQFDYTIQPWFLIGVAVVMTLLIIAFFVYGQIAPGR